jgi:hypothetical protein
VCVCVCVWDGVKSVIPQSLTLTLLYSLTFVLSITSLAVPAQVERALADNKEIEARLIAALEDCKVRREGGNGFKMRMRASVCVRAYESEWCE